MSLDVSDFWAGFCVEGEILGKRRYQSCSTWNNYESWRGAEMPQMMLPIFPEGVIEINDKLAVRKENGMVVYFNGMMPVFSHGEDDIASFQMIVSQFYCSGVAKQAEIARAFGVTDISVMRAVKKFREEGVAGFYGPRKTRGAAVLTAEVIQQAQAMLDEEKGLSEVASQLNLKRDTLSKAVQDGRLHRAKKRRSQKGT